MTDLVAAFLTSLIVTLAATLVCERVARRTGAVTEPREDRWHRRPLPLLGGVAIVVGVLPGVAWAGGAPARFHTLFLVALAMAGVGLWDDLRRLKPPVKLVAQIILAGILIQFGFSLRLTHDPVLDVLLTLFWLVGITNAFNLLDNMDGLAASMAAIAALFRLAFFLFDGDRAGAGVTVAFIGALAGFLVRNFPPAKIFMGDAGSLFLGFFLSGVCLAGGYPYSRGVSAVLVFPVLLLLIPIFDTTFVTVTRLLTGRPVARGGQDHTSHRLVRLGITERQAVAFLCGVSVVSGLLAIVSYRYGFTYTVVLLTLLVVGLVLLGVHLSGVQTVRRDATTPDAPIVRVVADLPYKRHIAMVALDVVLIVVAYYAAYLLRFEEDFEAHRAVFVRTVGPVIVLQVASLALLGTYRGLWRYTSLHDLLRLLQGITAGSVASVLYLVFVAGFAGLSPAVLILDWVLLLVLLSGTRLSFRVLGELLRRLPADFRPVLIYGAGDGGVYTLRELRSNPDLGRRPVGFLDDDRSKAGTRIHEVPVLGGLDALAEVLARHPVAEVVVSSRKIPADRLRRLESICGACGVAVVRASIRMEEDGRSP